MVAEGPANEHGRREGLEFVVRGSPPADTGGGSVTVVELDDAVAGRWPDEAVDVVALELDELRYRELTDEGDESVAASDVLSGKTGYQFLGHWLLSVVGARSGTAQTRRSVLEEVDERHGLALLDRDLGVTAQRLWVRLGTGRKLAVGAALSADFGGPRRAGLGLGLFWGLLFGSILSMLWGPFVLAGQAAALGGVGGAAVATLDAIVAIVAIGLALGVPLALAFAAGSRRLEAAVDAGIDAAPDDDPVTALLWSLAPDPERARDARDAVVVNRLRALETAGYDVVAAVSPGRRDRLQTLLAEPSTLPPREAVEGPIETGRWRSALYRGIGYACTVFFLALFVLLGLGATQDSLLAALFLAWFAVNFAAAGGVALLAGAHWTSASAGGAVAWLTSVNPLITPGLFVGYVELRHTDVRLSDVWRMKEALRDGTRSWGARLRLTHRDVGLFRVLAIMTAANLASFFASVLFVTVLLPYLAADVGGLGPLGEALLEGMRAGWRLLVGAFG